MQVENMHNKKFSAQKEIFFKNFHPFYQSWHAICYIFCRKGNLAQKNKALFLIWVDDAGKA